jgi:cytochrome c-type biogenesis protein CcmH/NrfF
LGNQLQVVLALYLLSAIGRSASGATVVYAGTFFLPYTFTGILSITEKLHCVVCNT